MNGDELADWIVPIPSLIIVSVGTGSAGDAIRSQRRSAPPTQALMPVSLSRCWRQATPATSSHLGRSITARSDRSGQGQCDLELNVVDHPPAPVRCRVKRLGSAKRQIERLFLSKPCVALGTRPRRSHYNSVRIQRSGRNRMADSGDRRSDRGGRCVRNRPAEKARRRSHRDKRQAMKLLMTASQIRGLPVVTVRGGEDIAEVRDVIYSPEAGRLVGMTLNQRGFLSGRRREVLPAEMIHAVGQHAVMVNDESRACRTGGCARRCRPPCHGAQRARRRRPD